MIRVSIFNKYTEMATGKPNYNQSSVEIGDEIATLPEMLELFEYVLRAQGYYFDGYLEVVDGFEEVIVDDA